jgi:hypothetical protein
VSTSKAKQISAAERSETSGISVLELMRHLMAESLGVLHLMTVGNGSRSCSTELAFLCESMVKTPNDPRSKETICWPEKLFVANKQTTKQINDHSFATFPQIVTEEALYPESFFHSNVKLLLMALACVVGAVTQFYPASEAHSRTVYLYGATLFTLITVVINLLYVMVDGEYILFTLPKKGQDSTTGTQLKLRSKMASYSVSFDSCIYLVLCILLMCILSAV